MSLCPSFCKILLRDTLCLVTCKRFRAWTVSHYPPVCSPTPSTMGPACDWTLSRHYCHTHRAELSGQFMPRLSGDCVMNSARVFYFEIQITCLQEQTGFAECFICLQQSPSPGNSNSGARSGSSRASGRWHSGGIAGSGCSESLSFPDLCLGLELGSVKGALSGPEGQSLSQVAGAPAGGPRWFGKRNVQAAQGTAWPSGSAPA